MPRVYPRGGGPWDQDPVVMRDFRTIRDYELQWKENQEKLDQRSGTTANEIGGALTPEDALNQMLEERGLEEDGYF